MRAARPFASAWMDGVLAPRKRLPPPLAASSARVAIGGGEGASKPKSENRVQARLSVAARLDQAPFDNGGERRVRAAEKFRAIDPSPDPLLFQRRKINFPAIHTAVEKPGEDRMIPAAKQNKPAVRVTAPPERTGGKHIAADFSPPLLVLAEHEFFTFARRHRGDFSAPGGSLRFAHKVAEKQTRYFLDECFPSGCSEVLVEIQINEQRISVEQVKLPGRPACRPDLVGNQKHSETRHGRDDMALFDAERLAKFRLGEGLVRQRHDLRRPDKFARAGLFKGIGLHFYRPLFQVVAKKQIKAPSGLDCQVPIVK